MSKALTNAPCVIMIDTQMGENIGMTARAMLNCGMTDLRLVRPRDGWPNGKAIQTSSNAHSVIESVKIFDTTAEAIADLNYVIATTSRTRDMVKDIHTPETAATEIIARAQSNQKCGIMFGAERTGLENDDISRAQAVLQVPLNPDYSSLNLAQAVLLIAYSWYSQATRPEIEAEQVTTRTGDSPLATQEHIDFTLGFLFDHLENAGFFLNPDKRPHTERNIRNIFIRNNLTEQEAQTLNGIIKVLATRGSG